MNKKELKLVKKYLKDEDFINFMEDYFKIEDEFKEFEIGE